MDVFGGFLGGAKISRTGRGKERIVRGEEDGNMPHIHI
jgi:hypothetical protein